MVTMFIQNLKKTVKFLLFLNAYFICLLFQLFEGKKIFFFNYNISEIGSIYMLDGFFRELSKNSKKINLFSVKQGNFTVNRFAHDLVLKKFQEYGIKTIKSALLNKLLLYLFIYENKFIKHVPRLINYENFKKLDPVDWLGEKKEDYQLELYNELDIEKGSWFVCFFSRDSLFDQKHRSELSSAFQIRNSNINNFIPAMQFIAERGGYAIRIGNMQHSKLLINNSKIIDYSFSNKKSAKLDFLLSFFPKFIIGCGSGIIDLSTINNVPAGIVNCAEYEYYQHRLYGSFIPKIIKRKKINSILKYHDYFPLIKNHSNIQQLNYLFNKYDLYHEENSSEHILELTKSLYKKYIEKKERVSGLENDLDFHEKGMKIFKPFYDKYLK